MIIIYVVDGIMMNLFVNFRWEYVLEYSREINSLLGSPKSTSETILEDPKEVIKVITLKFTKSSSSSGY